MQRQGPMSRPLPLLTTQSSYKSVPDALLAKRAGVPTRRTAIERTAGAGRTAMHPDATALCHVDNIGRSSGMVDRSQRHRLSRHRDQAEADRERGCSKQLHECFLFSKYAATRRVQVDANITQKHQQTGNVRAILPPVAMMPMAMPSPVTVPVTSPADFLRLEMIDLGLRHDRGLNHLAARSRELHRRRRRQRRAIRGCSESRGARGNSDGECEYVAAFHPIVSLHEVCKTMDFCRVEMNAR